MNKKELDFDIDIKRIYDYVSYQIEVSKKANEKSVEQNPYSLIQSIKLINSSYELINDVTLVFTSSSDLIKINDVCIDTIGPNSETFIKNRIFIRFDVEGIYKINEDVPINIDCKLIDDKSKEVIKEKTFDIILRPIQTSDAIIEDSCAMACFVTPNNEKIDEITTKAIAKLSQIRRKESHFIGYQSHDIDSIRQELMAIYDTLHNEEISYSNPPQSFTKFNRVRLPEQVLNEGKGTCLDLTLLYLSCIEATGLNPILILIDGHAFAGCFLDEDPTFPGLIYEDKGKIYNESGIGNYKIELIECTFFVKASDAFYEDAVSKARNTLKDYNGSYFEAINIKACHLQSYHPIPSFKSLVEKRRQLNSNDKHSSSLDLTSGENVESYKIDSKDQKMDKFSYWSKKLLDLSLKNKLVNFRVGGSTPELDVVNGPAFFNKLRTTSILTLIPLGNYQNEGNFLPIFDGFSVNDEQSGFVPGVDHTKNRYAITCSDKQLKSLFKTGISSEEETGSNILYLTIGTINFIPRESKRSFIAPLFLIPCKGKIRKGTTGFELTLQFENVAINTTVFEYIRANTNVNFDELYDVMDKIDTLDVVSIINAIKDKSCADCSITVDENKVHLSTFSFSHYIMWDDIRQRKDDLLQNKIIKTLVDGRIIEKEESNEDVLNKFDNEQEPDDFAIPLGADSSQIKAVIDCAKGESFVLDGPPGTGKSQTIVNMIVNSLYNNKTVLFVAEKMAALSVVKKRIDDMNLGCFCLELHSSKANKKDVLAQLNHALEQERVKSPETFGEFSFSLKEEREKLNLLIKKLHKKIYLVSLYDAIIKYTNLRDYDLSLEDPNEFSINLKEDQFEEIKKDLITLNNIASQRDDYSKNRYSAFLLSDYRFDTKKELNNSLLNLEEAVHDLNKKFEDIKHLFNFNVVYNRDNIEYIYTLSKLILSPFLSFKHATDDYFIKNDEVSTSVLEKGNKNEIFYIDEITKYSPKVFNYNFIKLSKKIANCKNNLLKSIKIHKIVNIFNKRRANQNVPKIDKAEALIVLKSYVEYKENEVFINKNKLVVEEAIETKIINNLDFKNISNKYYDEKALNEIVRSFSKDLDDSKENKILNNLIKVYKDRNIDFIKFKLDDFISNYNVLKKYEEILKDKFKYDYYLAKVEDASSYFVSYRIYLKELLAHINEIEDISLYNKVLFSLLDKKVPSSIIDLYKNGKIKTLDIEKYLSCFIYKHIIDASFKDPYFTEFNGLLFNDAIEKYDNLIEQYNTLIIKETASRVTKNFPISSVDYAKSTKIYQLKKLIENGGRKTTIRKILYEFEDLVRGICPCFLMSPLSAAQYLSLKSKKFDVVVFDEASQIPTSEAIGAISRGKSLVVAGDPEQMPPTTFFKANVSLYDDLEEFSYLEDSESLLNDCIALDMERNRLLWHYRSQHESLIAFSNNTFYKHSLYTFPSPDNSFTHVKFNYLPHGVYEKGINRDEAYAIVNYVKKHFSNPETRNKSLGIITFNIKQQELIQDMIASLFDTHPEYNEINENSNDKLFVKNLENVQGDERDIILFSIGFGYTKDHRFSLLFGPLSLDKGERRLNVAVTRARQEMVIFSSIRQIDINSDKAKNRGASILKRFLAYAEKGISAIEVENSETFIIKPGIESFLHEDLLERGYDNDIDVGDSKFKIDLAIKDAKGEYILGVICDSESYYTSPTCRDRNYVQNVVLNNLKWKIIRIYTLDYYKNKEKVINDIISAIKNVDDITLHENTNQNTNKIVFEKVNVNLKKRKKDYQISSQKYYNYQDIFTISSRPQLIDLLKNIIDEEGPINTNLLLTRFKEQLCASKSTSRFRELFNLNLVLVNRNYQDEPIGRVFYPNLKDREDIEFYRVSSNEDEDIRTLVNVPSIEIENAILDIIEAQGKINYDDLISLLASSFNETRMTSNIKEILDRDIQYILKISDSLIIVNGVVDIRE